MRKGRIKDAVLSAMGLREHMTLEELRSVVFSTFSEPELMRRGVYYSGKKTRITSAYIKGEWIDEESKAALVRLGIEKVLMDIRRNRNPYLVFDKERGAVSRVRK